MHRKLSSILLTLAILIGMLSLSAFSVFATEETTEPAGHTHVCNDGITDAQWQPWTDAPTAGGYYYLTEDVTLTDIWGVNNETTLCLNGHKLIAASDKRTITVRSVLTVTDCAAEPGSLVGGTTTNGAIIYVNTGKTCNVYNVTLTGGSVNGTGGSAIYMNGDANNKTVLNLTNVLITGNTATNTSSAAIRATNGCELNLKDTEISGNTAANAAAMQLMGSAKATLENVTITGNSVTSSTGYGAVDYGNGSATLILKGNTQITGNTDKGGIPQNLFLRAANSSGQLPYVNLDGLTEGAQVGITFLSSRTEMRFSTVPAEGADPLSYCFSDKDTYHITKDTDNALMLQEHTWDDGVIDPAPTCLTAGIKTFTCSGCTETRTEELAAGDDYHNYENGACTVCGEADPSIPVDVHNQENHPCEACQGTEWTAWKDPNSLPTESGHYYLTCNVTMTEAWMLGEKDVDNSALQVAVCLNGYEIIPAEGEKTVRVNQSATLTLTNCAQEKVTLSSSNPNSGAFIYTEPGANLYVSNVILSGGNVTGNGGAVFAEAGTEELHATFHFKNCEFRNNTTSTTSNGGGAIYAGTYTQVNVDNCIFDGNVCETMHGGAIYVHQYAQLNIQNSTISNNTAGLGGAIYVRENAQVTMDNCTVSGNSGASGTTGTSGMIHMIGGTVTFQSGSIGSATGANAVYMTDGTLIMNGGSIGSLTRGRGVYIAGGTFTMNGGEITGCSLGGEGIGVRVNAGGTFEMNGGKIYGNNATGTGNSTGGVRVMGTFKMTGGEIYGNTCSDRTETDVSQVLLADTNAIAEISGTAVITKGEAANSAYSLRAYQGTATVTGGSFTGTVGKSTNGAVSITGGTFDTDVSKLVADPYRQYPDGQVGLPCELHTYTDGTCTVCGISQSSIDSASLVLGDVLKLQVVTTLPAGDEALYTLRATIGNDEAYQSINGENGVFTVSIPAHRLYEKVTLELVRSDSVKNTVAWTWASYAATLRQENAENIQMMDLLDALEDYGKFAEYFADPENTTLPESEAVAAVNQADLAANQAVITTNGNLGAVASLYLDDACDIRIKFNAAAWADGCQLLVDGEAVPVTEQDGKLVYAIEGLLPQDWDTLHTFKVVNGEEVVFEIQYSVLSYAYTCLGRGQELQTGLNSLLKAMYLYNQAADAYAA